MRPRLIRRRRRDGLVEIRRARARDLVLTSDSFILLAMLAGWIFTAVVLVMALLFDPAFLLIVVWGILLMAVEHRRTRVPKLAPVPAGPPPGAAA